MMESRKRRHGEESETVHPNKRAATGTNSLHDTNTHSESDEPVDENLESFRKEAIFRQMKHYSRENGRSKARIAELEHRKITCEAGLAAILACWNQLVDAIGLLAKPEDLPVVNTRTRGKSKYAVNHDSVPYSLAELFDLSVHASEEESPELVQALEENMQATQLLVHKFMQLGGAAILQSDTYAKCQKAQTECSTLRSELDLMRTRLEDSESQREKYHEALVAAEFRADRLQSATVIAMQARAPAPIPEKKELEVEEPLPPKKETVSPEPVETNGHAQPPQEPAYWEAIAEKRKLEYDVLQKEAFADRQQLQALQLHLVMATEGAVKESLWYKVIVERCSYLEYVVSNHATVLEPLQQELLTLQITRREYEEGVNNAAAQSMQEVKGMLSKREVEAVRLRDQREQLTAELNERKHKETVKLTSLQEFKALAESRAERITILQSELARCRAQLAANAGDEDLMKFLFQNQPEDASYVEDLRARLTTAESRAETMELTLSTYKEEHPDVVQHMQAEADALQKLAEANRQLEKYQAVYGNASTLPSDVQSLSEQLQAQEAQVTRLKAKDAQHALAEDSLYTEIDKLSTAWEALDRQVKSKVYDLFVMEEKLTKSSVDRAKSENKYYQIMREKEAIENERKNATRNLEKQGKAVERLLDLEKNLTNQISVLEREVAIVKLESKKKSVQVQRYEEEVAALKLQVQHSEKKYTEFRHVRLDIDRRIEGKMAELQRGEEALIKQRKELELKHEKMGKAPKPSHLSGSQKEAQLQEEVDKCMSILKCSTCHLSMRSTVITKCMHSFCKGCVDARISTRQRKCPACNLPFAQSDVQQLYFQ